MTIEKQLAEVAETNQILLKLLEERGINPNGSRNH
jgi:hypothetical protein